MIGTSKTHTMFVIKDLPFVKILCGVMVLLAGSCLLVRQILRSLSGHNFDSLFVLIAFGLIGFGFLILNYSTVKIAHINRELKVVSIITRNVFTSTVTQYGFNEINGGVSINSEHLLGHRFPVSRIELLLHQTASVALTGRTSYFTDIYIEAVSEANKYLDIRPNSTESALEA